MARRKGHLVPSLNSRIKSRGVFKRFPGDNFLVEALEDRAMLATMVPGELLIQFDRSADAVSRANVRAQVSGYLTEQIQTAAMVDAGQGLLERITLGEGLSVDAAIQRIRSMPGVAYAEPNWLYTIGEVSNDTHYLNGNLWGMYGDDSPTAIGPVGTTNEFGSQAEKAWANGFVGSNEVFIGVIDEGIQFTHPDLVDNVWNNPFDPIDGVDNDGNGRIDDSQGWDFYNEDRTVYDGPGDDHGTHVAGTIGAKGGNADGVAGVNWNVTMISAKVFGPDGGTTFGAIQAIDYLTDLKTRHGINIVATNNSWGGGEYSQALLDAITRAANQDILFVASAGNFATNNDTWAHYPSSYDTTAGAGYDAVISVASITNDGAISSFSNYGDASVDLGAPGSAVYSTLPDGYGFKSGTSMASPHVSGTLALFAAATPGLPAQMMRNMLLGNVAPTTSLAGMTVTSGRLDIDRLLTAPLAMLGVSINNVSLFEGNNGSTFANFTVSVSPTANQVVSVNYATADGSATAGNDYVAANGTLTFGVGETTKSVLVEVFGDSIVENPESFFLYLSAATNALIVDPKGLGTIMNDDVVSISIDDVSVIEGNSGTKLATFTVSFDSVSSGAVNVNYATSNGTATAGSDYTAKSGTLFFGAGETSKTISITVSGDILNETNETFNVNLSGATGGTLIDSVGVGTITNDDASISINNVTLSEGNSGSKIFGFTDSLSSIHYTTVTVNYATSNVTATAGSDYVATSGSLSFAPGETSKTISVTALGDTVYESNETFSVNLSGASIPVSDSIGTGTLQNDDVAVSIAVTTSWSENTTASPYITASLSSLSTHIVTVNYSSSDSSALAGNDYVATSGTLTFQPGETSKQIPFTILNDGIAEANELFFVDLSDAVGATLTNSQGSVQIVNDDIARLGINDVSLLEGNSGSVLAVFTVTLQTVSSFPVSVNYTTSNGTASAGSDYTATTGSLAFAPGESTKTFSVAVLGDSVVEPSETFTVSLYGATNASYFDSSGQATIVSDDAGLTINDVTLFEGNSGSSFANYTVLLSIALPNTVTVDYATRDYSATGGSDYLTNFGTLTFLPGETSKSIAIELIGDTFVEPGEFYYVDLSNASNAIIVDVTGQGIIENDDVAFHMGFSSVSEGNNGSTIATLEIQLFPPWTSTITVGYATADGTATAGSDYIATSGILTFEPGERFKTIYVEVLGDTIIENDESCIVNLFDPSYGTFVTSSRPVSILNDDIPIWIDNGMVVEGNEGTSFANFTVVIGRNWNVPITMDFATTDGTAIAGDDYVATNGSLTFAPGETSKTISVPIIGDTNVEPNETFAITLSNAVNGVISDGSAVGTITNDDIVGISVADATVTESNGSGISLAFQVSLTSVSSSSITLNYATANGTATAGSDYTATSGTLTFAPGQSSIVVYVPVLGETTSEPNETLTLNLSNASGATIVDGVAVGTIVNDDVAIAVNDASVVETNSGLADMVFYIYLTAPSSSPVTFNFATANGTANANSDYDSFAAPYTIAPGQTGVFVHVAVHGDLSFEPNETFTMNVSNVVGAVVADSSGVGTIINDDVAPTFSINDVSGSENQGSLVFTVTLSAPQTITTKVKYATANGTAQGGNNGSADFNHSNGTLTFSPGQTTKTVTVNLRNDSTVEPNEIFYVNLSTPTGATIADNQGIGTILNDDGGAGGMVNNQITNSGNSGVNSNAIQSPSDPIVISEKTRGNTRTVETDLTSTRDSDIEVLDEYAMLLEAVTLDNAELSRVKLAVSPSTDRRWATNLGA